MPRRLRSLPFAPAQSARVYQTLLIEAPIFLAALAGEVKRVGATLEPRTFAAARDLAALREPLIVAWNDGASGAETVRLRIVDTATSELGPTTLAHPQGGLHADPDLLWVGIG